MAGGGDSVRRQRDGFGPAQAARRVGLHRFDERNRCGIAEARAGRARSAAGRRSRGARHRPPALPGIGSSGASTLAHAHARDRVQTGRACRGGAAMRTAPTRGHPRPARPHTSRRCARRRARSRRDCARCRDNAVPYFARSSPIRSSTVASTVTSSPVVGSSSSSSDGVGEQRHGDHHALLLPAGELVRVAAHDRPAGPACARRPAPPRHGRSASPASHALDAASALR